MPWDADSFRKFNHGLSPAQRAHAAHIANAVLRRSGDEGMAIAVANRDMKPHRDMGGQMPGGPAPQMPMQQGGMQQPPSGQPWGQPGQQRQMDPQMMQRIAEMRQRQMQQPGGMQQRPWQQGGQQPWQQGPQTPPAALGPGMQSPGTPPAQPIPMDRQQPPAQPMPMAISTPPGMQAPPSAPMQTAVMGGQGGAPQTPGGPIPLASGGGAPSQGGIGGSTPAAQGMNPMLGSMIQRYSGLPTERLQELAAQLGGSPQGHVIQSLLMQRHMQPQNAPDPAQQQAAPMQPQQQQPVAAQASGGATPARAMGGDMGLSPSQATPWWTRSEARSDSAAPSLGFLHGPTPGRADALDTTAPAGSHVIPADVVAGLGEGNSIAGAARMEQVIRSGPHGVSLPHIGRGSGPPRPPRPFSDAKGGNIPTAEKTEATPVMLSHGEYVVAPEDVRRWGGGDQERGHKAWDAWIVAERKRQIKKLLKLPGPVQS